MKKNIYFFLVILVMLFTCEAFAINNNFISLDDPEILRNSLQKPYELTSIDLHLPEEEFSMLNESAQNKLLNLVSLYGNREPEIVPNNNIKDIVIMDKELDYRSIYNSNINKISLNLLPGMLLNAEYGKSEKDIIEENTNISLSYWMNNRTLLRAEYDRENNEEINEISRLGISYKGNKYLTFSADYISNDFTSLDRDYSTIFGVEYKDVLGSVKYHYQLDYGEEKATATGLEFAYKDLATFNATYKIYNREELLKQLNLGVDLNLNDISTLSLEYQYNPLLEDLLVDEDEKESNIKAQLEIKF